MNKKGTIEIGGTKRFVAAVALAAYISALNPLSVFAANPKKAEGHYVSKEEKAEAVISAKNGGVVSLGGASIEIPEGALKKDTKISITRLAKVADTGESLYNAVPKFGGYRFLPAGTKFEKEVTITLPYNKELNAKPQSLEEMHTYFYDTEKRSWIKLERLEVDKDSCVVRSLSTHFTDMINATLTLPESASPVDVNLNSIKNLEAAKPDGHLIKFNPPKASNMGDASFNFELGIPAGRRGMQPQISIGYSSGGGNGIMGKGFDVNYGSAVSTDTRLGLPNYDTRDSYMLDGILLSEKTRKGTTITYGPQKESLFSRIVRHNAGTDSDYWEVTDKNGTKRIYAQDSSSCTGSGRRTFAWNLTRTEDVHGNSVVYEYEKQNGYVYPTAIYYTGFGETKGNYNVRFHYDENGAQRQDVRIDARSKEIISCAKLLTSITTHYKDGGFIRKYQFSYNEGLAKEKMMVSLSVANNADECYEYAFEYVEPQKDDKGNVIYFSEAEEWSNGRPLQTGNSTNIGADFNTGTAGGYGLRVVDMRLGGGVNGSVSSGENYTEDSMVDINGDGRPDAISQDGETIKVFLNNGNGFDPAKKLQIAKGRFSSDLDHEDTSSSSFGWNIYTGVGLKSDSVSASLGAGYSEVRQKSSSDAKCSFMDMDGDSLVDIVESGKTTYLKNKGNLVFEETPIYSSIVVEDVRQEISDEDAEEYRKTYLVQTPFRMWKAPYDGIVSIHETAHAIDSSYGPEHNAIIKTFIGTGGSERELEKEIEKGKEASASKLDFAISKDTDIYFISDNGKEPLNSDIEWNIDIAYSKVKPFKKNYPIPFSNYEKFPEEKAYSYTSGNYKSGFKSECEEKAKNDFVASEIGSELLLPLYSENAKEEHVNDSYSCTVKFTYNPNWKTDLSESQLNIVYEALIANGYIYPAAFTAAQFDEYLNHIKESFSGNEPELYYSEFAERFIRSVTENMYLMKAFEKDEDIKNFFEKYPMPRELAVKALENYEVNGFDLNLQKEILSYDAVRKYQAENNFRSDKNIGTVFKLAESNHNAMIVGTYNGIPLAYDFVERTLFLKNENGLSAPNFSCEIISDADAIAIGINKDSNGIFESVMTIFPENLSYKAENLSDPEMEEIINDIPVEYTSPHDAHWILTEENFLREDEIESLFSMMTLSFEQKSALVEALYQKKVKHEIVADSQDSIAYDYNYYVLKEIPDYETAGEILHEYKKDKVLSVLFPFYKKIGNNYVLDETQTGNAADEKLLLDECSKHFFGKYGSIKIEQHFENEHLYDIRPGNKYSLIAIDEKFVFAEKSEILPKVLWNSAEDFSSPDDVELADTNYTKEIYKYKEKAEINGGMTEEDSSVIISNDEFLYGGRRNWFYGIWKGALCDIPFSEARLREFKEEENISESEFNAKKEQVGQVKTDESATKDSYKETIHFYLPMTGLKSAEFSELDTLKNDSVSYPVNYDASLCGTVSAYSETVKSGNSRTVKKTYYMPFISGNIIHADRMGGISYYNIEGLHTTRMTGNSFAVPSIRRTFTTGTDRTPNVSVGFGGSVPNEIIGEEGKILGDYNVADEVAGLSASRGWNKSESDVKQTMQDIDGNGIPDILQVSGSAISVVKGNVAHDGIQYESSSLYAGAGTISRNSSDVDVYGGSVGPGGSVAVVPKNSVKKTEVRQIPKPNASGGKTVTSGTSVQKEGLIDLNGDGLPDYYDGKALRLNNGSGFALYGDAYVFSSSMTESANSSFGTNFSIGKSYGGCEANSLKSGASLSLGGSYSASSSNTEKMFMDINGDGLQDIVRMSAGQDAISVFYNTGKGFAKGESISLQSWGAIVTDNFSRFKRQSDGNGFDLPLIRQIPLVDSAVGKGLSDTISNPYGNSAARLADSLEWNSSVTLGVSGSLGVNVNIGIDIITPVGYFGTINMTFNAGEGISTSASVNGISVRMMDLDGDGLADHVLRIPGYGTYWKRNISGRYGQLAKVRLPQGGSVRIEYAEKYGTTDNPNFKYVMSGVTAHDGCGETLPEIPHGAHSVTTKYEYENAYYDRQKKDFYGFATVRTEHADGTRLVEEYHNRDYYAKGCPKESRLHAKDGTLLSESRTELCDAPHALPAKEESRTYEKSSGNAESIRTATEYEYDGFGNCVEIRQDFGGGEILIGEVAYDNTNTTDYIVGMPVDIRVYDSNGTLLRRRSGSYDEFGELAELRQYFDAYNHSVNTLKYDKYGNISSVSDSRGATTAYAYDKDENMLVTEIAQSGSGTDTYKSNIAYDIATQTKKSETDSNGNTLRYEYDGWQRTTKIFTSYDGATPAVGYEYQTPAANEKGRHGLWHAVTNNKVTFDADDDSVIKTVLQTDGLGRAVRTAKTGFVNGADGWNASGAVEYDNKGRTVKEGMTEFIQGGMEDLLASVPRMTSLFTSYEYDEKDRREKTTLPDGSEQSARFEIRNGNSVSCSTDPMGNVSVQETDSRGNIVRVARLDASSRRLTEATYRYSAMGEMLEARDAKGHPIKAEYDMIGRRTALESLDSGRQEFAYDECSNLARETSNVLRGRSKQILYEYDGLNRLVRVDYPDTEDTLYTYGGSNAPHGAAGKILRVDDASGTLEYEYGRLGEVTKETRTLATHLNGNSPAETAAMEYRSDYLGRMQHIVYPDGEKISYGYDAGGQVVSVTGSHWGHEFKYVTNILYDEYGQRTRIDYGNGTFTEYEYDSARRWLDSIKTQNKWGQSYQNITYSFDRVGNVLGYENDCLDAASGNYKTRQTYGYDNLYQLIKVDGSTTYNPYRSAVPEFVSDYSQIFEFDSDGLGNMTSKTSTETVSPQKNIGDNLNYQFDYVYDENYAHRLVRAGDRYYQYDANGNVVLEQDGSFEDNGDDITYHKITKETEDVYSTDYGWGLFKDEDDESGHGASAARYRRTYTWNEKNQLISSVDSNYSTAYVYGQDGQRSNKYTQSSETLYFNKMWTLHTDSGNNVYGGQTAKNIYLGETRIVTKLNSGSGPTYQEEYYKQYFYHSDHLGSASLISDYKGDEYQRIEYTPYGETWVEKTSNTGLEFLPYKFTAKELDKETGLYYYGARYLDPKYSRWISTDPALGEYIPVAPVDEEAKRHNQNLPGMGGVFNTVNANLYHYAGNNPVKYTDPDGKWVFNIGCFGFAGAGFGSSVTLGFSIGYSKEKGVTFGVFSTESLGAEFNVAAEVGMLASIDIFSKGVESGISQTMTIGASADIGISAGCDLTLNVDTNELDFSIGISESKGSGGNTGLGMKVGLGVSALPGEVHIRYNSTQTKATSLKNVAEALCNKVNKFEESVKNYFIEKIIKGY